MVVSIDRGAVKVYITMENYHISWVNQLFLWPFSIAMLDYQRVPQNRWCIVTIVENPMKMG